jgi:hypothetical protein
LRSGAASDTIATRKRVAAGAGILRRVCVCSSDGFNMARRVSVGAERTADRWIGLTEQSHDDPSASRSIPAFRSEPNCLPCLIRTPMRVGQRRQPADAMGMGKDRAGDLRERERIPLRSEGWGDPSAAASDQGRYVKLHIATPSGGLGRDVGGPDPHPAVLADLVAGAVAEDPAVVRRAGVLRAAGGSAAGAGDALDLAGDERLGAARQQLRASAPGPTAGTGGTQTPGLCQLADGADAEAGKGSLGFVRDAGNRRHVTI